MAMHHEISARIERSDLGLEPDRGSQAFLEPENWRTPGRDIDDNIRPRRNHRQDLAPKLGMRTRLMDCWRHPLRSCTLSSVACALGTTARFPHTLEYCIDRLRMMFQCRTNLARSLVGENLLRSRFQALQGALDYIRRP